MRGEQSGTVGRWALSIEYLECFVGEPDRLLRLVLLDVLGRHDRGESRGSVRIRATHRRLGECDGSAREPSAACCRRGRKW